MITTFNNLVIASKYVFSWFLYK